MKNFFFILAGVLLIKVLFLFGIFTKNSSFFYFSFYLFLYLGYMFMVNQMPKLFEIVKKNWIEKIKRERE